MNFRRYLFNDKQRTHIIPCTLADAALQFRIKLTAKLFNCAWKVDDIEILCYN